MADSRENVFWNGKEEVRRVTAFVVVRLTNGENTNANRTSYYMIIITHKHTKLRTRKITQF